MAKKRKQTITVKAPQRLDDEPQNERILRDLEVLEGEAKDVVGGAGCPEWMCGSTGNHNEVLAVTS